MENKGWYQYECSVVIVGQGPKDGGLQRVFNDPMNKRCEDVDQKTNADEANDGQVAELRI